MGAKYRLLPYWLVTVKCEIWPTAQDGRKLKIEWDFDFSVEQETPWLEIRKIARNIMSQQFAKKYDWKIKKFSLTTSLESGG